MRFQKFSLSNHFNDEIWIVSDDNPKRPKTVRFQMKMHQCGRDQVDGIQTGSTGSQSTQHVTRTLLQSITA